MITKHALRQGALYALITAAVASPARVAAHDGGEFITYGYSYVQPAAPVRQYYYVVPSYVQAVPVYPQFYPFAPQRAYCPPPAYRPPYFQRYYQHHGLHNHYWPHSYSRFSIGFGTNLD